MTECPDDDWEAEDGDWPTAPPIFLSLPFVRLFTIERAAALLDVSERTVHRLLADGELRRVRISPHAVRVRSDDVEALIARRTEESVADAELPAPDRRRHGAHGP